MNSVSIRLVENVIPILKPPNLKIHYTTNVKNIKNKNKNYKIKNP